jgi:hypothetical protein
MYYKVFNMISIGLSTGVKDKIVAIAVIIRQIEN